MKYNEKFLNEKVSCIIPPEEVDCYMDDAIAGMHHLEEFEEAAKNLVAVTQIMFMQPRLDRTEEMAELLLEARKLTNREETIRDLYYGLTCLYYKMGYPGKAVECALLYENHKGDNRNQSSMIYNFMSIILQETGHYDLAYSYLERQYELVKKMEGPKGDLYHAITDNNRIYILLKLNRLEEAHQYCDHMMKVIEKYPEDAKVQQVKPSIEFTKLYLATFEGNHQSIEQYMKLMDDIFQKKTESNQVNKSVGPHLEILKRIHEQGGEDVFPAAYGILMDNSFVGERYPLCCFMLQLYKENPSLLSEKDYLRLLEDSVEYAKSNADNYSEVLHSLIGEELRLNEIQKQLNRTKDEYEKDPLTKVYNRSQFNKVSPTYFEKHPMGSIVFTDIDSFKNVNDQYGHIAGDYTLKRFAKMVNDNTPANVSLFRFGGDEFVILSPYEFEKTEELLSYIRNKYKREFEFEGIKIQSDFSYGIVQNKGASIEEILQQADLAMYENKKSSGR